MSFTGKPISELSLQRSLQKARVILGLDPDFSSEDLRGKFATLVKSNHPDHGGTGHSNIMSKLIIAKDICKAHLEKEIQNEK